MANKADRNSSNAPGAWYVDTACIACGACTEEAPENFKLSDDGSAAFVFKQPLTPQELAKSASALDVCPVQAIGNDA
jgi:ferredoxin